MITLSFTPNLARHVTVATVKLTGKHVREALDSYFAQNPAVRGYVLDDQGAVRKHVAVFVNGNPLRDRVHLSDALGDNDDIFIAQALSGG